MAESDKIDTDMDGTIDKVMADMKGEDAATEKAQDAEEKPVVDNPVEENPDETGEDDKSEKGGDKGEEEKSDNKKEADLSDDDKSKFDAIIERGVRAGMSIKDILALPNAEVAERVVATAEKAAGISPKNEDSGSEGADEPADEIGKTIKEMEADGDYDANMLKILKGLYEENKALKASRETEARKSVFDTQFNGLDEGVRSHIDAASKSKLESKYKVLKSAYSAAKVKMTDDEIFKEAAKLAIGDILDKASAESKAAKAAARKALTIARPGGEQGLKGRTAAQSLDDIVAAVAKELE